VGSNVGSVVGSIEGSSEGSPDGANDGSIVGIKDGDDDGNKVGWGDGCREDGITEGFIVEGRREVGLYELTIEGFRDGKQDGEAEEGTDERDTVGS